MKFNDEVYNVLKWLCLIFLPAVATLYAAIDGVFELGYVDIVCTIIVAVATFIGSLIGISTVNYNKEKEKDDKLS